LAPNLDGLADEQRGGSPELFGHRKAEYGHAAASLYVTLVENTSVLDVQVVHLEVLGPDTSYLVAGIPTEIRELDPRTDFR